MSEHHLSPKKPRTDALSAVSAGDVISGKVMKYTVCTMKAAAPMPGSLKISHPENLRLEGGPTSLILLCDTSGSMKNGGRIVNLRLGVQHISAFMRRTEGLDMDLTLISFSDDAKVVYGPAAVPDEETINALCEGLLPTYGTNIGSALEAALTVAAEDRTVHVVLFTDGYDSHGLGGKFDSFEPGHILHKVSKHNFLTLHCVGICTDADASMLNRLSDIAYTGTFQIITDKDISGLMGSLWGLMSEMVGVNGFASVSADGVEVLAPTKFPLRICHPPVDIRLPFVIPDGAKEIVAEIKIGDAAQTVRLALPREDPDHVDSECAIDAIADLRSKVSATVATKLQAREFDAAKALNEEMMTKIQAIGALIEDPGVADVVNEAVAELTEQAQAIEGAKTDATAARELELRNLSRSNTERSNTLSINPQSGSRTMSQNQRDFSLIY